jgi:hypothetical protein
MYSNILKRDWNLLFNEFRERWPDITQADLDYIDADRDKLIQVVSKRRHVTEPVARRDVEEFLTRLKPLRKFA